MRIKLTLLFLTALCLSFTSETIIKKSELSKDNPFKVTLKPIAYANVTAHHIEEYVNVTMDNAKKELSKIKSLNPLSFENTFGNYDRINNELGKAYYNAFMLYWVSNDSLTRAKGLEGSQQISGLFTDIGSDKTLFEKFQSYTNSEESKTLNNIQKSLVTNVIEGFKLKCKNVYLF